jgi:WD40 repeat protein
MAFHPGGHYLMTGGWDGIFAMWKWDEGKMIKAFTIGSPVMCMRFDRRAEFVAIGFETGNAIVIPVRECLD